MLRFDPGEFSEDVAFADPKFLSLLDRFAITLKSSVYPSTAKGTLARFSGNKDSRHYAINRKSDACDVFCNCDIAKAWTTAVQSFSGVGVYFDTHFREGDWPMLHVDTRPKPLLWYRDTGERPGEYHYPWEPGFYKHLFEKLSRPVTMMVRP